MITSVEWDEEEVNPSAIKEELDERLISCLDGNAQIHITPQEMSITNGSNGLVVNNYGSVIDGKVHFGRTPSDVRIGSFWTFNDELLTTLPSTTYTPIPVLKYSEPPYVKWLQKFSQFVSGLG